MAVQFYRYISYQPEVDQITKERKIRSTNPTTGYATWYSSLRLDDPLEAQRFLALKYQPTHRIGPLASSDLPNFNVVPLRPIAPLHGQPGGGVEACTNDPVYLTGLWDFGASGKWLL